MSLKENVVRAVVLGLGVFYGAVTLVHVALAWLKHSFGFLRVKQRPLPPPCLMDESLGRHCFAKLRDITLHYVENGDRSKPLMLCVHGFPEFWYSWRHQLRAFSNDYWVVAVDLRGYGDSDKPAAKSAYKMDNFTSDLKGLLEVLGRQRIDVLMGHDWGGAIVWAFTGKYPDLVHRLVVMNCPHPNAFRKILMTSMKQFKMSWYMFLFQLPCLPEFWLRLNDLAAFVQMYRDPGNPGKTIISPEDIEAYKYTFSKPGALTPPVNYYRNIDFGAEDDDNNGRTHLVLDVPALLVWGTGDVALSEELAEASAKYVKSLKIEKLDGVTHWVNQDAPTQVNKVVSDFLCQSGSGH